MKKTTDYAYQLYAFFTSYLPKQRNLSVHTLRSYRQTFKMLSMFCRDRKGIDVNKLSFDQITDTLILEYLDYLETERGNSIATRNQRLSAISAFFNYASAEMPEATFPAQKIFSIPFKKHEKPLVTYICADSVKRILMQPDSNDPYGRRDLVMLSVLYDSAARVSELCSIKARDVKFLNPCTVLLHGKGSKLREIPVSANTRAMLKAYVAEHHLDRPENLDIPLFLNHSLQPLTPEGVAYVLKKYAALAAPCCPDMPSLISPHVFRHSKAMHLLNAGVELIYIRDFLGHEDIRTTEIYAKSSPEAKLNATIRAQPDWADLNLPDWRDDENLLHMLLNL